MEGTDTVRKRVPAWTMERATLLLRALPSPVMSDAAAGAAS